MDDALRERFEMAVGKRRPIRRRDNPSKLWCIYEPPYILEFKDGADFERVDLREYLSKDDLETLES